MFISEIIIPNCTVTGLTVGLKVRQQKLSITNIVNIAQEKVQLNGHVKFVASTTKAGKVYSLIKESQDA